MVTLKRTSCWISFAMSLWASISKGSAVSNRILCLSRSLRISCCSRSTEANLSAKQLHKISSMLFHFHKTKKQHRNSKSHLCNHYATRREWSFLSEHWLEIISKTKKKRKCLLHFTYLSPHLWELLQAWGYCGAGGPAARGWPAAYHGWRLGRPGHFLLTQYLVIETLVQNWCLLQTSQTTMFILPQF